MFSDTAPITLVKNAKLWRWDNVPSVSSKIGSAVPSSWFCIQNGIICEISSDTSDSQLKQCSPESCFSKVIDAKHQLVIPGLHDAHIHVCMTGESNYFLDLRNCNSIEKLISTLAAHSSRACWHIGVANTMALQLAGIIKGNEEYEDLEPLESPPGGVIDRDSNGRPTGILRERAVELVLSVMNKKTDLEMKNFISEGLSLCAKKGLTAVQTNDANALSVYRDLQSQNLLPIRVFLTPNYEELIDDCRKKYPVDSENCTVNSRTSEEQLKPFRPSCIPPSSAAVSHSVIESDSRSNVKIELSTAESRLIVERLKIYADGSLGAETAALRTVPGSGSVKKKSKNSLERFNTVIGIDDVDDNNESIPPVPSMISQDYTGILTHTKTDLKDMVSHARDLGFRVEVHAIGDAAVDRVLESLEEAKIPSSERPVITHCQVLGDDLIDRMVLGGTIANVQPSFVPTDMKWVQKRLSISQQKYSYAWKTLIERGVCVAGGSDAPIETCSPLVGMFDAIHRQARSSSLPSQYNDTITSTSTNSDSCQVSTHVDPMIFRPEECLSFSEALWIYTVGSAYAAGCEHFLGRLDVGYAADFVILDPAVVEEPHLLMTIEPSLVVVGGIISYCKEDTIESSSNIITATANATTSIDNAVQSYDSKKSPPTMGGPYIPGKNGKFCLPARRRKSAEKEKEIEGEREIKLKTVREESYPLTCACRLLGRYCSAVYQ